MERTLDPLKVTETTREDESTFVLGQNKADPLRPRDIPKPGQHEMVLELHVTLCPTLKAMVMPTG